MDVMIPIYVKLINLGLKQIEEVPENIREQVREKMELDMEIN
jgi:hypothetical protein